MKNLFFALFLAFAYTASAQTTLDSLRADVLTEAATAFRAGKQDEASIWLMLVSEMLRPDFETYYRDVFPVSLDLFIDRNTPLKEAALKIKLKVLTTRI